jgi:hypothetical protein
MVVETAFAHGYGPAIQMGANGWNVAIRMEVRRIVRVHPGGPPDESPVPQGNGLCPFGRGQRLADADDSPPARSSNTSK